MCVCELSPKARLSQLMRARRLFFRSAISNMETAAMIIPKAAVATSVPIITKNCKTDIVLNQ